MTPTTLSPLPHPLQGCAAAFFFVCLMSTLMAKQQPEEWLGSQPPRLYSNSASLGTVRFMVVISRSIKLLPLAHVGQCLWATF